MLSQKGQSLLEILISVAIGAIFVIGAASVIAPALKTGTQVTGIEVSNALGKELSDNVRAWSEGDWHNILNLATSSANTYYLITSSSPYAATSGIQSVMIGSSTYTRYFYVSDVFRDGSNNATTSPSGTTYDPSIKLITVGYNRPQGTTTTVSFYLTRNHTNIYIQTDWSGGSGQKGPVTSTNNQFATSSFIDYTSIPGSLVATTTSGVTYSQATPAFVQGTSNNNFGGSATMSQTFGSNVTSGDTILFGLSWYSTSITLTSVTSTCVTGNLTVVTSTAYLTGNETAAEGYGTISSSGACTVTAQFSGSVESGIVIQEVSGISTTSPSDGGIMNHQDLVSSSTSGNITTTNNGDYIFGLGVDTQANGITWTAGAGFTNRVALASWFQTEDQVQTTAGTIAATFATTTSGHPTTGVLALKPAVTVVGGTVATSSISSTSPKFWAWNDFLGWLNFYNGNLVAVSSNGLTSYASSSAGDVSLDCATSRKGNICATSQYQVANDGAGNLSGWGWNDTIGWISFCGGQSSANCPGGTSYNVYIDSNGYFHGYGWNDTMGWISFTSDASCTVYCVQTFWTPTSTTASLDSTTFDTGITSGAQFNSIMWKGPTPATGASVSFQFAASNSSSGPWTFTGTGGTTTTYYTPSGPGVTASLLFYQYSNDRYFRYRVYLQTNASGTSPQVNDVIVNWSP